MPCSPLGSSQCATPTIPFDIVNIVDIAQNNISSITPPSARSSLRPSVIHHERYPFATPPLLLPCHTLLMLEVPVLLGVACEECHDLGLGNRVQAEMRTTNKWVANQRFSDCFCRVFAIFGRAKSRLSRQLSKDIMTSLCICHVTHIKFQVILFQPETKMQQNGNEFIIVQKLTNTRNLEHAPVDDLFLSW